MCWLINELESIFCHDIASTITFLSIKLTGNTIIFFFHFVLEPKLIVKRFIESSYYLDFYPGEIKQKLHFLLKKICSTTCY